MTLPFFGPVEAESQMLALLATRLQMRASILEMCANQARALHERTAGVVSTVLPKPDDIAMFMALLCDHYFIERVHTTELKCARDVAERHDGFFLLTITRPASDTVKINAHIERIDNIYGSVKLNGLHAFERTMNMLAELKTQYAQEAELEDRKQHTYGNSKCGYYIR